MDQSVPPVWIRGLPLWRPPFILMAELLTTLGGLSVDDIVLSPGNEAASVSPHSRKVSNMINFKDLTGVMRMMSLTLGLAFTLSTVIPALLPSAAGASEGTWQDLVLLYSSDCKGKIEPCG